MSDSTTIVERWAEHFNAGNSEAVAHLYTPDAVLWGTLSQDMTVSPDGIKAYFLEAARLGLTVKFGSYTARSIAADIAAIAGHYDLFRELKGRAALFPARYSLVLVKEKSGWLISQHHSSLRPDKDAAFIR